MIELLVAADNAPCDGASEKRRRAENEADCVMWLRAQYSLAALIRNRSLCQECRLRGRCTEVFHYRPFARSPGATALRASARENAEELLLRASLVLGNLEGEHRGQLAALAAAVEPRAMALLAEIMDDRETVGTELSDAWRKRGWFLNPATSSEREELVRKLREHVLSRHDLVGWMESRDTGFQLAPKFEYGVACYEADCERYAAAFDHLEKAIKATPSLLDSARVDPSFCGFRRHSPPRRWQDLERLVP